MSVVVITNDVDERVPIFHQHAPVVRVKTVQSRAFVRSMPSVRESRLRRRANDSKVIRKHPAQEEAQRLHARVVIRIVVEQVSVAPQTKQHGPQRSLRGGYIDILVATIVSKLTQESRKFVLESLVAWMTDFPVQRAASILAPECVPYGEQIGMLTGKANVVLEQCEQVVSGRFTLGSRQSPTTNIDVVHVFEHCGQHASLGLEVEHQQRARHTGTLSHLVQGGIAQTLSGDTPNRRIDYGLLAFLAS